MRAVSRDEMRTLDEMAMRDFKIPGLVLMENAGRGCVDLLAAYCRRDGITLKKAVILCGNGNNGGDGLVMARHLHNRGVDVIVVLIAKASSFRGDALQQMEIIRRMKIPCEAVKETTPAGDWDKLFEEADVAVDALFGIGLSRALKGTALHAVQALNRSGKKVFCVDVPSGIDADSGEILGDAVKGTWTATMGLPKQAFKLQEVLAYAGEIAIIDISIPREILI